MLPLSHSPDEEKPTEKIKLGNDVKQALEEDLDPDAPGASVDKKPNDSSALGDDDSQNKPNPENMTRQETTDVLEANESVATDAPPPEPPVKHQPMRQWSDLSQSEQLDVLWTLCEWQFTGAMRLRTLLGDDDLGVGWVSVNIDLCSLVELTKGSSKAYGTRWMGQQEECLLACWG
jgi:hypothetical protein